MPIAAATAIIDPSRRVMSAAAPAGASSMPNTSRAPTTTNDATTVMAIMPSSTASIRPTR